MTSFLNHIANILKLKVFHALTGRKEEEGGEEAGGGREKGGEEERGGREKGSEEKGVIEEEGAAGEGTEGK
jgi:hypothetical protein